MAHLFQILASCKKEKGVIITAPAWNCFSSQFILGLGKSTGKSMPVILSPKEHNVPKNHSLNPSCPLSLPVCREEAINLGVMKGVCNCGSLSTQTHHGCSLQCYAEEHCLYS